MQMKDGFYDDILHDLKNTKKFQTGVFCIYCLLECDFVVCKRLRRKKTIKIIFLLHHLGRKKVQSGHASSSAISNVIKSCISLPLLVIVSCNINFIKYRWAKYKKLNFYYSIIITAATTTEAKWECRHIDNSKM